MEVVLLLVVGAAAGFLATRMMKIQTDIPTTIAIGVGGAIVGGLVIRGLAIPTAAVQNDPTLGGGWGGGRGGAKLPDHQQHMVRIAPPLACFGHDVPDQAKALYQQTFDIKRDLFGIQQIGGVVLHLPAFFDLGSPQHLPLDARVAGGQPLERGKKGLKGVCIGHGQGDGASRSAWQEG